MVLGRIIDRCLSLEWLEHHDRRTWVLARQILLLRAQAASYRRSPLHGTTIFVCFGAMRAVHRRARSYVHESRGLAQLRVDADPVGALWHQVHKGSSRDAVELGDLLAERLIALAAHVHDLRSDLDQQAVCSQLVGRGLLRPFARWIRELRRYVAEKVFIRTRSLLTLYYAGIVHVEVARRTQRYGVWCKLGPGGALKECLS